MSLRQAIGSSRCSRVYDAVIDRFGGLRTSRRLEGSNVVTMGTGSLK